MQRKTENKVSETSVTLPGYHMTSNAAPIILVDRLTYALVVSGLHIGEDAPAPGVGYVEP